jgi:hypothetical protein
MYKPTEEDILNFKRQQGFESLVHKTFPSMNGHKISTGLGTDPSGNFAVIIYWHSLTKQDALTKSEKEIDMHDKDFLSKPLPVLEHEMEDPVTQIVYPVVHKKQSTAKFASLG